MTRYAHEHAIYKIQAAELRQRIAVEHQFVGALERVPATELLPTPDERWNRYKPWVVREVEHWKRFLENEDYREKEIARMQGRRK